MSEHERYARMREFSRVNAHIPFEVLRIVPPQERQNVRAKILGETMSVEFEKLPDIQDKLLSDWFKVLNSKLDSIINMLIFQREGFSSMPSMSVNISGGGLSFSSKERYNVGDIIEMKMLLPMVPPLALYLYGEVVKSNRRIDSYNTAVKFIEIDEEIRDEIVKFVFHKQKQLLRERRI